jgi:hypothetical protein
MSIQGGVNRIVDVSTAWIRFLIECPIPVSKQLSVADAGPPGSAWDVRWGTEDVQAVQAESLTITTLPGSLAATASAVETAP